MDKQTIYNRLKFIAIIITIVALGTLAVNQTMGYYYKSRFLQTPCQLCVELNPEWERCLGASTEPVYNFTGEFVSPKP